MTEEKYLTVSEFATRLNVDPQTVYRWIRAGKIATVQVKRWGAVRIPASEIDRMTSTRN
jgi:excisionase family DNA binding protein